MRKRHWTACASRSRLPVEALTMIMKRGVLLVNVPKRPEVQPKRITIGKGDRKAKA